jgi:hypothetical protein
MIRFSTVDWRYRKCHPGESTAAGEEIAAPPSQEQAHIVNLMDALRASVANAEQQAAPEAKPEKKMAPSKGKEGRSRKRKTS